MLLTGTRLKQFGKIVGKCILQDGPLPDKCWVWQGGISDKNESIKYGRTRLDGVMMRTHRAMWTIVNGPIPSDMCICHHCDNGLCQNPRHHFIGTRLDNNRDREEKKRGVCKKGSANGNSVLTEPQVIEIHTLYSTGQYTLKDLATKFNCSMMPIHGIVTKHLWKHVERPDLDISTIEASNRRRTALSGENNGFAKLTNTQVAEILSLKSDVRGWRNRLAERFNVSATHIGRIWSGTRK